MIAPNIWRRARLSTAGVWRYPKQMTWPFGRGADAPHRIRVVIADDNPAFCHAWQRVIDAGPDMTASRRLRWRHRAGGDPAAGSSIVLIGAVESASASASGTCRRRSRA